LQAQLDNHSSQTAHGIPLLFRPALRTVKARLLAVSKRNRRNTSEVNRNYARAGLIRVRFGHRVTDGGLAGSVGQS